MKWPARYALWLLPLAFAGCHRHPVQKPTQIPNQALAPLFQPSVLPEVVSIEAPPSETYLQEQPLQLMEGRALMARKPVKRKKPANPPEPFVQETPSRPSTGISAIGELSAGDTASIRRQTDESIIATERGLNGINRSLNDSEQKIAGHIREFIKQARTALASGDVGGAHTLASKAAVLLDELTK